MTNDYLIANFLDYSEQLKVNHPINGLINFQLWDHQIDVAEKLLKKKYLISLSSRQMGMTTLMISFSHWYTNTFPNSKVCYTSDKQTILNVCRELYKQLNYDVKLVTHDANVLELTNGSQIFFIRPSIENFCSRVFNVFLIDNAAYIDGKHGWWSSIKQYVVKDGYLWINSTPTDKTTWFYQVWVNTKPNNKIRLPWNKRVDHTKEWFNTYKNNFPSTYKQEIKGEFL